jgi:sulfur-carrier protein adenylyltransferase/sulfurtransferase
MSLNKKLKLRIISDTMDLNSKEVVRYHRHLVLQGFGSDNQVKLKQSRVLVVGAGGLGSPALLYLAAAGVGTIGIVDFDTIDVSNLQRQVLFTEMDVGKNKAEAAVARLIEKNSLITYHSFPFPVTSQNALEIVREYDVIVDGTDNFPTRYLLNDAAVLCDKPLVYGSILKFEGQVSVFNQRLDKDGHSANYRDLFPIPPDPSAVPNCEQAGVLGVLPGIIGAWQANEVIKLITGLGDTLANRLMIFDSLSMDTTVISIKSLNSREQIQNLIDYDEFCNPRKHLNTTPRMKEVTVQELKEMMESKADFQLIDVREPHEYDICNIEGELIPQGDIPKNVDKISKSKKVVIHCRSGARSGNMVQWLESNHGFTNLYNLKGGILAWAREIDPEMPTY